MKRRGFLAFLGGAAVAGPSMAKQAVSATLADMSVAGVASTSMGAMAMPAQYPGDVQDDWVGRAAKLALRSKAEHEDRQRGQYISGLDPDLTTYRSFALHTKIAMQKRRDYWRSIENEKTWLQRRIDGILDW